MFCWSTSFWLTSFASGSSAGLPVVFFPTMATSRLEADARKKNRQRMPAARTFDGETVAERRSENSQTILPLSCNPQAAHKNNKTAMLCNKMLC